MAAKTVARKATKPRSAKRRAAKRVTRRVARKARKPKAPKAVKSTKPRAPKRKAVRKSKKARRTVKPRKPKRVTRKMQTGSYRKVWNGTKKFTKGGLTKADLMMNSRRKIVSKKMHAHATSRKSFAGWTTAVKQARKEMGISGFVLMNRGAQGTALYARAKAIYNAGTTPM